MNPKIQSLYTTLSRERSTFVPPTGPSSAPIAIVGEQPGNIEVYKGEPFIGPAGRELDQNLTLAKLKREDIYLTNAIKDLDFKLSNYLTYSPRTKTVTTTSECDYYFSLLIQELNHLNAKVIIPTGNVALYALTKRWGITNWRGSILETEQLKGKKVVPTLHPATVIKPKNQYLNKYLIIFDLIRARDIANGDYTPTKRELLIKPSYNEAQTFLQRAFIEGLKGTKIAYDIELSNMQVSCISFSFNMTSMCIPFIDETGDYFPPEQELSLWQTIAKLLEHPEIKKVGQNLTFDTHFLLRRYGICAKNLTDTMINQRILTPDYKAGLDFITSIWTDHPYYKADGKFWLGGKGSYEKGWTYNAIDSIICDEAAPKQEAEIKKMDNWETKIETERVILPLVFMMEHGVRIDLDLMTSEYERKAEEIEKLQLELNQLAGQELNANSNPQLKEYFYNQKGHHPYKSKAGTITVDENALRRIARKNCPEASKVLEIRSAVKERSTYFNPKKVDPDSRMRCSYNPVGTRFSRLSSSSSIFRTGTNLQNLPNSVLKCYTPDEGYILYTTDLSQAENRIVAYVGNIKEMIDAFETDKDVHSLTGALITGKSPEEIQHEHDNNIYSPLGSGNKTWRFWGKKANHGFNYDLSYKTFSLYNEITEKDGKIIWQGYHKAYPRVQKGFHEYVKECILKDRTLINLLGRKIIFKGNLRDYQQRDKVFKAAYSCIPQGTVGDIINRRGLCYIYYDDIFRDVDLLMQVHDEIKFQIPLKLNWKKHAELIIKIKKSLEQPLTTHYGREFIIPSDLGQGLTMDKKTLQKYGGETYSTNITELADRLENGYKILKENQ